MSSSASLEDAKVCDQLRSLFSAPFPMQKFRLWFTYQGMPYVTTFDAEHTAKHLLVRNTCVKMAFVNDSKGLIPYEGVISANSPEKACFTPTLTRHSSAASSFSSVDVLQTLKTKIATLFPMFSAQALCITDVAEKDGVRLSPFRILRGGDALYEKYGYQSGFITVLRDYMRTLTWGDIKMTPVAGNINAILGFINETEGKAIPTGFAIQDTTLITTILSDVTFEHELAYKKRHPIRFFSHATLQLIGAELIKKLNATGSSPIPEAYMVVEKVGEQNAWVFCFNPESEAWRRSKDALLFAHVDFGSNSAASSRKTRRRRRRH